jgi:hypothetical protein
MYRKTLRQQAVGELMLEENERVRQGQQPNKYWHHEIVVKERMKQIRARLKAEKKGPPANMRPLRF